MHTFKRGLCALLALCLMFLSTLAFAAETPKERTSEHYDTYTSDTLTIDITREAWTFKSHKLKFLVAHAQTPLLQQAAQGGRADALAEAGHHAAGHKNILHSIPST